MTYLIGAGGLLVLAGLVFQTLLGTRKIKLKGALHSKVHRWVAYGLIAAGATHGLLAAGRFIFGWF